MRRTALDSRRFPTAITPHMQCPDLLRILNLDLPAVLSTELSTDNKHISLRDYKELIKKAVVDNQSLPPREQKTIGLVAVMDLSVRLTAEWGSAVRSDGRSPALTCQNHELFLVTIEDVMAGKREEEYKIHRYFGDKERLFLGSPPGEARVLENPTFSSGNAYPSPVLGAVVAPLLKVLSESGVIQEQPPTGLDASQAVAERLHPPTDLDCSEEIPQLPLRPPSDLDDSQETILYSGCREPWNALTWFSSECEGQEQGEDEDQD